MLYNIDMKKIAVMTKKGAENHPLRIDTINLLAKTGYQTVDIVSADDFASDFCSILVFGGDGTMLEASKISADFSVPILGVNLGNLGFLAEFEATTMPADIVSALDGEIKSVYNLETKIGSETYFGLNEIVIKTASTRPISIDLFIDDMYVDSYHGDGIIVSTPTGSTAYALSAGGPVLAPDVKAYTILPVCAHSLHSRPLVIADSSKILLKTANENIEVIVDGNLVVSIDNKTEIEIYKSENKSMFINFNKSNFYEKLLRKMNRWGTTEGK